MGDKEQYVNVMLEEYKALRAEITQRISSGTQLLGFTVAAVALLAGAASKDVLSHAWVIGLGVVLLAALAVYWWWSSGLIRKAGKHIAELEVRIDDAVPGTPLTWERKRQRQWPPAESAEPAIPADG